MAARGLFNATDLEPLLAERGISLSSVQVWRLVTQVPERLSLPVLAALCDVLEASPADLIATSAESAAALPKAAARRADRPRGAAAPPRDAEAAGRVSGGSEPAGRPAYKRDCCRCGRFRWAFARFPDGHVCRPCLIAALGTRGPCPGCGGDRFLFGRRPDGTAICRECAGITREFTCRHCGYEGKYCVARTCERCELGRKLAFVLDDGTGRPRAELTPLADYMRTQMNPWAMLDWLTAPGNRELLAGLATGLLAISHQALAARPDRKRSVYVRDLLVASGVLPAADRQLTGYEGWLDRKLASLDGHPHQRLLREFSLWHQLPRMRATAAARPLRQTACKYAQLRFRAAEDFLDWITARGTRPADVPRPTSTPSSPATRSTSGRPSARSSRGR